MKKITEYTLHGTNAKTLLNQEVKKLESDE